MLNKLRKKKTQKKIWITLAILIIPAFVFWGFGGAMRSQKESAYVGRIAGRRIPILEYREALDATRNLAIIQFGDKFQEAQKSIDFAAQAWDRLILLAEAKNRKIKASDKEVVQFVESYPFFKGTGGQFDNRLYLEMLRYVFRTQPRTFEEQTRQNLILSKLYAQISDKISLADKEVREEYEKLNAQISIYYLSAMPQDFAKGISPTDEEIKAYFAKNSLQFKQPLSFNVEYATLPAEEKDKAASEKKINKLFLRLKKNEDFAKAAIDSGLSVKETGLFAEDDSIPGIGWMPQITNLIAKTKAGQYVNPVQVDKNYYILKVKERKEPRIPDFAAVKDKVKAAFIQNRAKELARQSIEGCLLKMKEPPKEVNFDRMAKLCGLKSDKTDMFKYGSYIEGIGASDIFWTKAQGLKAGAFSEVIEMPAGFYIIKLKDRIPVEEKKFAEEKEQFSQLLLLRKKQEYFAGFTEELKRRAQRSF